jgi:hypothetical protein
MSLSSPPLFGQLLMSGSKACVSTLAQSEVETWVSSRVRAH